MRIVIDMQGMQTESRLRSIGPYTLSLTQAIVRNRNDHEIILALNGLFSDTIEPIRAAFDGLLPQENIRVWYTLGPVCECVPGNAWRREVAERVREAFLADLKPDAVFVSSLFEGYKDNGVTSIGVFAPNLFTVVAMHEPIPKKDTQIDPGWNIFFLHKLESLRRADILILLPPLSMDEICQSLDWGDCRVIMGVLSVDNQFTKDQFDVEAQRLLQAIGQLRSTVKSDVPSLFLRHRPKLAYVSPLPPERTGIAVYSAELLPALNRYYDIEVVVSCPQVADSWITANCPIRSTEWFCRHADRYQRVVYHFGNSHFHQHMIAMLEYCSGVIILHDFFIGDLIWHMQSHGQKQHGWLMNLYDAHGYVAVKEKFNSESDSTVVFKYPCNMIPLRAALGLIVHSDYSKRLAVQWYGPSWDEGWATIPLTRTPAKNDREKCRNFLRLNQDIFIVCSFGLCGPTKLNHRLLAAWLASGLGEDSRCRLFFVGENHGGDYGRDLAKMINKSGVKDRIHITGWVSDDEFRRYLAAADVAVQLRTLSRGETSAAVLDCMNHALPTIVNANGSLADLPRDAVWMLDDEFDESDLVTALETLWRDEVKRKSLAQRARELILTHYSPDICARLYAQAIEDFYRTAESDRHHLVRAIAALDNSPADERAWLYLASCIAQNQPDRRPARNLFVDITATSRSDLKTGIERVARALLLELINTPQTGYRIEPVYLTDQGGKWHYRYARRYTLELLECPNSWLEDEPVEAQAGDVLFGADFAGHLVVEAERANLYQKLKQIGVSIYFTVFDLLPIKMPEAFPPKANEGFEAWLRAVCQIADGMVCISRSVADHLCCWLEEKSLPRMRPLSIDWMHLGANLDASVPTRKIPANGQSVLSALGLRYTFLMVGTIEPRKGYLQAVSAFDQLWQQGVNVNLAIVGKEGWKGLPEEMRRTIPKIVDTLRHHPERDKRLFWLEGISDEYLEKIYATSTCLISASEGEGFGLPLIEAAQHKLPIIARDIPVFREVAKEHAYYFKGREPSDLALAIKNWLAQFEAGKYPMSEHMPWLTWKESAERLKQIIFNNDCYMSWHLPIKFSSGKA